MMKMVRVLPLLLVIGCAQHYCRRAPDGAAAGEKPAASEDTAHASERHVKVYKYDGSLQCKQGKALAVEQMAKQLKDIKVFASEKKSDGLMHIQVCGSNTGVANVYEINESDLGKAEALGFKKWTFE